MKTHNDHKSDQANRRRAERIRTLKRARIILNNRSSVFDCVVRNISATGAMLQLGGPVGIPSHFELALGRSRHGPTCTVRWRSEVAMGVSFDDAWQQAA